LVVSARTAESEFGGTLAGTVMGTPQFMSPEQARGEVETLDGRSDIYALGAILYQILALRPPVQGDDAYAIVEKVARGEVEPLGSTGVPPVVSGVPAGDSAAARRDARHSGRDARAPHLPGGRIPDSLAAVVRKAMAFEREQRYASVGELQADLAAYQGGLRHRGGKGGLV
jgi:serine/threonine protein kinase